MNHVHSWITMFNILIKSINDFYCQNQSTILHVQAQCLALNLKSLLHESREGEIPITDMVNKLMKDKTKADKSRLPGILPVECESSLSSIFVEVDTPLVSNLCHLFRLMAKI